MPLTLKSGTSAAAVFGQKAMLPKPAAVAIRVPFHAMWRSSLGMVGVLSALCIVVSLIARIVIGRIQPFWLDEAWTGAIISQPDLTHLFQQIYLDSNAPIYFILMYGWSKLFGLSDVALRFPSLLAGLAAPLVIAFTRIPGIPRDARLVWAALLALWFPGIWFSQEARCYALLLLVCTIQTLAFARLLVAPRLKLAFWWAAWSSAAILTHYYAGFVTLCEGLAYLWFWRGRALRTAPAAIAFIPAVAWIAYHLPRLAEFARPGVGWYNLLQPSDVSYIVLFLCGTAATPIAFAVTAFSAFLIGSRADRQTVGAERIYVGYYVVATAAAVAACLFVGIGFLRPSFTSRYLIPVIPGIMLGLALLAHSFARRWANSYAALLLACLCGTVLISYEAARRPRPYTFERAARDLAADGITQLVFSLDNPTSVAFHDSQLVALGGFFFGRAGHPVRVVPVVLRGDEDASTALLSRATSPGSGILWVYDLQVHDTAARKTPPRIAQLDPAWRCRNYGKNNYGVIACVQANRLAGD